MSMSVCINMQRTKPGARVPTRLGGPPYHKIQFRFTLSHGHYYRNCSARFTVVLYNTYNSIEVHEIRNIRYKTFL